MKISLAVVATVLVAQTLSAPEALAIPEPGSVFREYVSVIAPGYRRPQRSHEVFSSVHAYAPKELPPNPRQFVNEVEIADLEHATRVEVTVELWSGHPLTTGRRVRVNGNAWIALPDPALPDARGQGGVAAEYQYFQHVTVAVPLAQLRPGKNNFQFDVVQGKAPAFRVWGTVFRVFYDPQKKAHAKAVLVSPAPRSRVGDDVSFAVKATTPAGQPVARVDYLGHYEDVNVRLDGANHGWQYRSLHGELRDHIGSATVGPAFNVRWNTTWVPDQTGPMRFLARVTDSSGLATITPVVEGVAFGKRSVSVRLFKSFDVPKQQATRAGKPATNKVDLGRDGLEGARAARMFVATWSGTYAEAIGVNGKAVATSVSPEQNAFSADHLEVPISALRRGVNEPFVLASTTTKHGTDVMWPGIELKVQYPPSARRGR